MNQKYHARHILSVTLPDCLALLNKVGESWQEASLCSVYLSQIQEETSGAYSDRALAQINEGRIAAESITPGKPRSR